MIRRLSARHSHPLAFALVLLGLAGCAESGVAANGSGQQADVFFPTWSYSGTGGSEAGMLQGRLIEREGCLLIEDKTDVGTDYYLPLWPDTYSLSDDDPVSVTTDDGTDLAVGDFVELTGGTSTPSSQAEEAIGRAILPKCNEVAWKATSARVPES
jgi:hypothetical protein